MVLSTVAKPDSGVSMVRGSLGDFDSRRRGAAAADGVIHTAFTHDFSRFAQNTGELRHAIEVLGGVLDAGMDLTPGAGQRRVSGHRPHRPCEAEARGNAAVDRTAPAGAPRRVAGGGREGLCLPSAHRRQGMRICGCIIGLFKGGVRL